MIIYTENLKRTWVFVHAEGDIDVTLERDLRVGEGRMSMRICLTLDECTMIARAAAKARERLASQGI